MLQTHVWGPARKLCKTQVHGLAKQIPVTLLFWQMFLIIYLFIFALVVISKTVCAFLHQDPN